MCNPHAPLVFPRAARFWCMPGDVDVSGMVGRNGAPAVEAEGGLDDAALGLERRTRVVETGIKHRRCPGGTFGLGFVRTHPRDMDSPILAHSQVGAPNIARGDSAAGLRVGLERAGEGSSAVFGVNVENVPGPGITLEVDQV